MKKPLSKLIEHVRSKLKLPPDAIGFTVHRDVALRLKNLTVAEREMSLGDPGTEIGAFKIRVPGLGEARRDANLLMQQRSEERGYRMSATLVNPNGCTFWAYDEGRLAGAVSVRLDSKGELPADELYRAEIAELRHEGRKICEMTRLAVDAARQSKPVLAGLFHTVFLFAQKLRGFDFVVVVVNPRHAAYYRRVLGFGVIGEERHNPRVEAPALLMGASFRDIGDNLQKHAGNGKPTAIARNLYAYGFSPEEEAGILRRLRSLDTR